MRISIVAVGGAAMDAGLVTNSPPATAQNSGSLGSGDVAILRFLSAIEQIESDLWLQYAELGGAQTTPSELPGLPTGGSQPYILALQNLDGDMPQYIHDNTEDEFSHHRFLNAFLAARGVEGIDLRQFANLQGSQATGANKHRGRITNLMQLTVDTSWWTRYRSRRHNPDLQPGFRFPPGGPEPEQRAVHGNPQDRCRSVAHGSHPGHRQYRGIPFRIHRARRQRPVPHAGSEGY